MAPRRRPNTPTYDTLRADYYRLLARNQDLLNALRQARLFIDGAIQRYEQKDVPPDDQVRRV